MDRDEGLPDAPPDFAAERRGAGTGDEIHGGDVRMFPVVGLGGSAGGIPALIAFFGAAAPDAGMAFVVVLHLSSSHESTLAEVLQRATRMPVTQVAGRTRVEPDRVYVIPPGKALSSSNGYLTLTDLPPERGTRSAVDLFLRTLADSHGPRAAAIVLSGADGDGASGLKRVKERGGLTIAQDPGEAEYDGMPRSAIATGMVDWVLGAREMPARLVEYYRRERSLRLPPEEGTQPAAPLPPPPDEGEAALRDVLAHLRARTGRDFSYYKRATIVRRLGRRMQVNGVTTVPEYLEFVRAHPGEAGALQKDLLISVTNFFRDREAFGALESRVPDLFRGKGPGEPVRVWVAACATGEEAYSVAMLLAEHARRLETSPPIQVFATDLDEEVVQTAREGLYPDAIAGDVSEERLREFFVREPRGFRVRRELRELVLFARHDLLGDPPFSRLDLATCRNLLIYLCREAQDRAVAIFHFALRQDGWLFLGASETVNEESELFRPVDKKHRLYARSATSRVALPVPTATGASVGPLDAGAERAGGGDIPTRAPTHPFFDGDGPGDGPADPGDGRWAEIHYRMLEVVSPPSAVVGGEDDILHLSENAGRFLRYAGGRPTRNLLQAVHPALRVELRAALYRAGQTGNALARAVPADLGGGETHVTMRVSAMDDLLPGCRLVVFEEAAPGGAAGPPAEDAEPASRHLEREIERMKSHLRDSAERHEVSTEELQANNEELQAMNEELRSATEELETGREELQSINEELTTVNQELKGRVEELARANGDLFNLMAATAIATVFLDRDLRIMRYTPPAVALFHLIPTDVGRPLEDLRHRFASVDLADEARRVLATFERVEREVGHSGGAWYLARLLPYRTDDDRIAGVVLTFVDITARRRAERKVRQLAGQLTRQVRKFDAIASGERDLIFTLDPSGRLTYANAVTLGVLGRAPLDALGKSAGGAGFPEEFAVLIDAQMPKVIETRAPLGGETPPLRLAGEEGRVLEYTLVPILDAGGGVEEVGGIARDATRRKEAEESLRSSRDQLRLANAVLDERARELGRREVLLEEAVATSTRRAEQLRALTARLGEAERKERGRLASVLHDHVQQMLIAAKLRVEMVRDGAAAADGERRLSEAVRLVEESIDAARSLAVELVPPLLHDAGLPVALAWLGERTADRHGLRVAVEADPDADPDSDGLRDLLFQFARELLLNVVKHARADSAEVRLGRVDGRLRLEVADRGAGFRPADRPDVGGSFGLFHIRERVEALGGSMSVESAPGAGTRVRISVS